MKTTILFLLTLIPVAATATLYGFLESCANMVEMLLLPFTPAGKTAGGALVFGGPFLVLFIGIGIGVFAGVPLVASAIAACLGGWSLRLSGRSVSGRSAWITITLAAAFTSVFVLVADHRGEVMLMDRPGKRPNTPVGVLACVAGGNATLSVFVATCILRRIASNRKPPRIPHSCPSRAA